MRKGKIKKIPNYIIWFFALLAALILAEIVAVRCSYRNSRSLLMLTFYLKKVATTACSTHDESLGGSDDVARALIFIYDNKIRVYLI